ncbi:MAG: hypothetical protein MPJ50_19450 [Pirellulales bacterium]|nr:hypothetical protein [Pirellulales bacterium]
MLLQTDVANYSNPLLYSNRDNAQSTLRAELQGEASWTHRYARRISKCVCRNQAFSPWDEDDVHQELLAHIFQQAQYYDHKRGSLRVFNAYLMRMKANELIRKRESIKSGGLSKRHSIHRIVQAGNKKHTPDEMLARKCRIGQRRTLQLDLLVAYSKLTPEQQQFWDLKQAGCSMQEIAKIMESSKEYVRFLRQSIASVLTQMGITV